MKNLIRLASAYTKSIVGEVTNSLQVSKENDVLIIVLLGLFDSLLIWTVFLREIPQKCLHPTS